MSSTHGADVLSITEGSDHRDVEAAQLPYTHLRHLGQGGSCTVDEVEDRNTGLVYARKVFMPKRRNRLRPKELFDNEVKVLRSVERHHHMIQVFATYTVKETGSLALLLSPVADGGDLDEYLGVLTNYQRNPYHHTAQIAAMKATILRAFGCLAVGLAFLHENRIRHKDIKTSRPAISWFSRAKCSIQILAFRSTPSCARTVRLSGLQK
jgi:serine/threonine protein kinase